MADQLGKVAGVCVPGWEPVRQAFESNFSDHGELGASVCIHVGDSTVVDLCGGFTAEDRKTHWTSDTIIVVFSNTKGATALCAHVLADRGQLELDAPVAKYWPEFAQNGKSAATVAMMLNHSVGVPALREPVKQGGVTDWDYMIQRIEQEKPFWEPGTQHGYHAVTFGWTVGELVRRVSGRSFGTFFREEIAGPLGLDFWIGIPANMEREVVPYIPPAVGPKPNAFHVALGSPMSLAALAVLNTGGYRLIDAAGQRGMDTPEVHAAEIGGAGGIASARGIAGMYKPLATRGGKLVSGSTVERMMQTSAAAIVDPVLRMQTHFGLGFMKTTDNRRWADGNNGMILGERAFGHPGAGGSLGFADPDCELSFGYVMNRMGGDVLLNVRGQSLVNAAYGCLGYRSNEAGAWIR